MGKVTYAPGIDKVSGLLAKPKKKAGHSCGSYLLATHREAPTENPNCSRLYIKLKDAYKRSTPASADELMARTRFATVRSMVQTRRHDLSKITSDQEAFDAQKNSVNGKKTMNAYLWMVCGDEYDTEHPRD